MRAYATTQLSFLGDTRARWFEGFIAILYRLFDFKGLGFCFKIGIIYVLNARYSREFDEMYIL